MPFSGRLPRRWLSGWHRRGTRPALSLIATGTALAMVLGLPIGRIVGQYFGWRTTFFAIGMGALVTPVCLVKLLPKLPSEHSGSLKSLPLLMRRPALLSIYLLTVIVVTAHYTAYSYIEPFVQVVAGFSGNFATLLLLLLAGGHYWQYSFRQAWQSARFSAGEQRHRFAAGVSAAADARRGQ